MLFNVNNKYEMIVNMTRMMEDVGFTSCNVNNRRVQESALCLRCY